MTAAKLAQATGLSEASIARIRKGGQNITIDVARRIADATGGHVTVNDLAIGRQQAAV